MTPIVRFFGRVLFPWSRSRAVGVLESVFANNAAEASTAVTAIVALLALIKIKSDETPPVTNNGKQLRGGTNACISR